MGLPTQLRKDTADKNGDDYQVMAITSRRPNATNSRYQERRACAARPAAEVFALPCCVAGVVCRPVASDTLHGSRAESVIWD